MSVLSLKDKTAVVTGGGRGIGAAVARALAGAGAAVVIAARTQTQIDGVADELRAAGREAWPVVCDVADPESVSDMARMATEQLGHVDILVNNAGIAPSAPLHKITLDEWNRVLAVNVTGTFLCTQAFVPGMVERGWGRVVNVASIAGKTGAKYIAAYSASKHAVLGFTRSVAAEVAASGVTVNAVCPGYVDSDMTREAVDRIAGKAGLSREKALQSLLDMSPQKRLIEPEEVAHTVLWLCGDAARSVNGEAIVMDGGALLA